MKEIKIIAIDIDNCISDDRWRMALVDHNEPDLDVRYKDYNDLCDQDAPLTSNICEIEKLIRKNGLKPVFVTARPEEVREKTRAWLSEHASEIFDGFETPLLMRPEGDRRHSPELKPALLAGFLYSCAERGAADCPCLSKVDMIVDDRIDVLESYGKSFPSATLLRLCADKNEVSVDEHNGHRTDIILQQMAQTFRERNAVYGSNYKMIGPMIKVLFPNGVPPELVVTDQWHLFELILVKLSRYAISNLSHTDSIHDAAVYAAMCESINKEQK